MPYPLILAPITIDTTNSTLIISEAGTNRTVALTPGTYYLRGDGASDDLCAHLKTRMAAAGPSTNTYNVAVEYDTDKTNPSAHCYISIATGTDSFALKFANASTTFDASILGFPQTDTASNTSTKTSSLSSSVAWVSDQYLETLEPLVEQDAYAPIALNGRVRSGVNGSLKEMLSIQLGLVDGARTHKLYTATDPDAAFASFFGVWAAGGAAELYDHTVDTGTLITSVSSSQLVGLYHLDKDSAVRFSPQRLSLATELYSWQLLLREAV